MKRFFTLLLLIFMSSAVTLPNTMLAHSHYKSSTPADGDVLEETITEITITFDGAIGTGDVTVTDEKTDETMPVNSVVTEGSSMTATLEKPLPSGNYHVTWKNVGDDTHAIEGEFSFEVAATDAVENEAAAEEAAKKESEKQQTENKPETEKQETSSNTILTTSVIGALIFIGALLLFAILRKRK
ncbi:copper resistance protein CopC [Bacillus sp. FSL W7-1360]